ncbi:MAG: type II secretion system F family protein [Planctomycetales bacterium]|jgi:tight adherence protein B|nr:type II secretion system F family protein [Planctomycetales bacterium]
MDPLWMISLAAFVGVTTFSAALFMMVKDMGSANAEDRLDALAGTRILESVETRSLIKKDLINVGKGAAGALARNTSNIGGWRFFLEQANSPVNFQTFVFLSVIAGMSGTALGAVIQSPPPLLMLFGLSAGLMPLVWLKLRRKQRFAKFDTQLPDALSLIARALRSGHSLNAGLRLVVEEMAAPIGLEFQTTYEEQNLGIPIEQALKNMMNRMPNLDLKFFVTAVAIQRQTGGDLAEIIDKICEVVRERFKIRGMIQALTGEGRLSGTVLMALPIAIFIAVYILNTDYVMLLFTTEMGKKMIGFGIVMQVLGAICIQKIIDIKI